MPPTNPPPPSGKPGDSGGPRPGKADWRGKAKPAGATGRSAGERGATWKEKTDLEYRRAKRRYRRKLVAMLVGSVSLLAWLAYLYVNPHFWPRPHFLAVVVIQYGPSSEPLGFSLIPPNGWAQEDADRFGLLTDHEIAKYSEVEYDPSKPPLDGFHELRKEIGKSRRGWLRRDPVIVYLSMHGAVNKDGNACLIPPGVPPEDLYQSDKWLPLLDVLKYLFAEDGQHKPPANKLLILDCNRMDANWGLGLLYNGFADGLQEALNTAGVPGLVILNSTSPGQIGWTSPEQFQFQGSVFGHYVWLGLMGEADRYWPDRKGYNDTEVSLEELHRYVRTHVQDWVQRYWADAQVPMLVRRDEDKKDFALVRALSENQLAEVKEAPPDYQPDPRWERDVAPLWNEHAKLEKQSPWRNDPLGWEGFQHGLLQLEQLVLAGKAYVDEFKRRKDALEALAKRLGEDPLTAKLAAYSLPLAASFSTPPRINPEAKRLLEQFQQLPDEKRRPEDLLAFVEKTRQAGKGDGTKRQPDVIEWHFVRMLQAHLDPEVRKAQPDLVKQALLARQAAESAAAPEDERVHWWLQNLVSAADNERRLAEDKLFVGSGGALKQAQEGFAAAIGKVGGGGYAEAQSRAEAVARAFDLRDRAWARTPYLAQWVLARLNESDPALSDELAKLISATRQLGRELDRELALQGTGPSAGGEGEKGRRGEGENAPPATRHPSPAEGAVRSSLDKLEKAYEIECNLLENTSRGGAGDLRRIATVLAVPLVMDEKRRKLRNGCLEILERLGKISRAAGAGGEGPVRRVAEGTQPGEEQKSVFWLQRLPRASEHPALILLSRAGLQDDERLLQEPAAAVPKSAASEERDSQRAAQELELKKKELAALGGKVRELLAKSYEDANQWADKTKDSLEKGNRSAAEARSGLSKADRLIRAAAGLWQTELAQWEAGSDPVSKLRKFDLYHLLLWHCRRTLEDFWGPAPGDPASYFDVVAGEYLASAGDLDTYKSAAGRQYGKIDLSQLLKDRRAAAKPPVHAVVSPDRGGQVDLEDPSTKVYGDVKEAANLPSGEAALYLESRPGGRVVPIPMFLSPAEADPKAPAGAGQRRVPRGVRGGAGKSSKFSYWVLSDKFPSGDSRADLVSLYRGHRVEEHFTPTPLDAGIEIVFQPLPDKQSITVKGDVRTEGYVVFILDYSGSMLNLTSTPEGEHPRYRAAMSTLLNILKELAADPSNPYRVGVMVYGHRITYVGTWREKKGYYVPEDAKHFIKWDPKREKAFLSADDEKTAKGDRLRPGIDVQTIWPLAPLTNDDIDQIRKRLAPLKALGETPLHRAINEAIDHLNEVRPLSPDTVAPSRHIVVITDGVNWQFDDKVGVDKVESKFAKPNDDIRLDVIEYLLTDADLAREAKNYEVTPEELREQRDRLRALAVRQKGERRTALNDVELAAKLQESLRLSRYRVYREDASASEIAKIEPKDLSKPFDDIPLSKSDLEKQGGIPFVVKLVDPSRQAEAKVWIEGGEALLLRLSTDGQRLEHERYTSEERERKPKPEPEIPHPLDASRRLYIAPHLPKRDKGSMRFFFSIQSKDATLFSPRPAEAWVEIQPVLKNPEAAPLYVFYDMQFVDLASPFHPQCPVPMLECMAPNWPDKAIDAKVRLWCKFTKKTQPDKELRLSELFAKTQPGEVVRLEGLAPEKLPGLTLELRQKSDEKDNLHEVIVTERYARGAGAPKELNALKVEMHPRPLKLTAVHHYIPEAGIVRHTFTYPLEPSGAGRIPQEHVIRVTLHEAIIKDAIAVDLQVEVPR